MNKRSLSLLLATATLSLSACSSTGENPFKDIQWPEWMKPKAEQTEAAAAQRALTVAATADCPRVSAMPELSRVTQFADESRPVPETILSETVLTKLDTSCITTESSLNLDIMLNFTSSLGTAGLSHSGPESSYSHPYFVAVVAPDGKIIAKDVFALSPVFTSGQKIVFSSERLQQTIPLSSSIPANKYQIMVGFQLSEAELSYNRSLKPAEVQPMPATPAVEKPVVPPLETTRPPKGVND